MKDTTAVNYSEKFNTMTEKCLHENLSIYQPHQGSYA